MINKRRIIVSLTSWPPRINSIIPTLNSLINQKIKPDLIIINLSIEEFPNKNNDLPESLVELIKKNKNTEINWVEKNTRTFKKIIPTLQRFYGEKYYLFSVDDDCIYRNDYFALMIRAIEENKAHAIVLSNISNCIIGNRVLYKSEMFQPIFWNCLTDEIINYGIDDSYTDRYISKTGKKLSVIKSKDVNKIINMYNTNYNAFHDEYLKDNHVDRANEVINKINFNSK